MDGFCARRGGHARGDFLCQRHLLLFVPDPARGGKPPLEIKWPPNPNPVSRPAAAGKSASTCCVRTALVLAVVVMVNYLGAKFYGRFYLSPQAQQLSSRTLNLVRSLTNRVSVTVYFDTKDEENFYPTIIALLNEYQLANPDISVKTVDYVRDAGEAQKIKEQYKLDHDRQRPRHFRLRRSCENRQWRRALSKKTRTDPERRSE